MKINYTVKDFNPDPRTLKDGDWIAFTPESNLYRGQEKRAWKFKEWLPVPDGQYKVNVYIDGGISLFACKNPKEIKKVRENDPNYELITKS